MVFKLCPPPLPLFYTVNLSLFPRSIMSPVVIIRFMQINSQLRRARFHYNASHCTPINRQQSTTPTFLLLGDMGTLSIVIYVIGKVVATRLQRKRLMLSQLNSATDIIFMLWFSQTSRVKPVNNINIRYWPRCSTMKRRD